MKKKIVISHPTGNQNSRNAVLAFQKADMLAQFYTTVGLFSDSPLQKINHKLVNEIKRRTYDASLKNFTTFHSEEELLRLFSTKFGLENMFYGKSEISAIHSVYRDLDRFVSRKLKNSEANIMYGYVDGTLKSFEKAKQLGMKTVCDMQACYYKKVEEISITEKNKNPQWAETISILSESDSKKKWNDDEFSLADEIIVASNFSKTALNLYEGNLPKIKVIPYGFPEVFQNREYKVAKKLRVLFVGKLSQQKGLSYLFEAVSPFKNHIELTIIGSKSGYDAPILEKELKKHKYLGTLPHDRVLNEMHCADVLIFPTLMDAFGMVITESMSQGTPVITTDHSAGPEIITNNENGWIVNAGNADQIKNIIETILSNRNIAVEVGRNASEKARTHSWEAYQNELVKFVASI